MYQNQLNYFCRRYIHILLRDRNLNKKFVLYNPAYFAENDKCELSYFLATEILDKMSNETGVALENLWQEAKYA